MCRTCPHRSKTLTILLLLSKSFAELDMEIYEGPRLYFVLTVRQDWLQLPAWLVLDIVNCDPCWENTLWHRWWEPVGAMWLLLYPTALPSFLKAWYCHLWSFADVWRTRVLSQLSLSSSPWMSNFLPCNAHYKNVTYHECTAVSVAASLPPHSPRICSSYVCQPSNCTCNPNMKVLLFNCLILNLVGFSSLEH